MMANPGDQASSVKNDKRNRRVIAAVVAVAILGAAAFGIGVAGAKYTSQDKTVDYGAAYNFYFTSPELSDCTASGATPEEHTISQLDGTTSTTTEITLSNSEDNLRYSEVDVAYTVTVSSADSGAATPTIKLKGTSRSSDTGIFAFWLERNDVKTHTLEITGMTPDKTYTVTAESVQYDDSGNVKEKYGNYYKKLQGTYYITPLDKNIYAAIQNSSTASTDKYIEVAIWTKDYGDTTETVNVVYPPGLAPDNTNQIQSAWVRASGSPASVGWTGFGKNTTKVIRFFPDNPSTTYTVSTDNTTHTVTIAAS